MRGIFTLIALLGVALSAHAQHPSDVALAAARGEYFNALVNFEKMPKRIATTDSVIAAGKSAWALGLPSDAAAKLDEALLNRELPTEKRAELLLSRGIIEHQEGREQSALLFAEKARETCGQNCPSRSTIDILWGDSLASLGQYGAAEGKFVAALNGATPEEIIETSYRLGVCRMKLGKLAEAKADFEKIPFANERAPSAIRNLAVIATDQSNFEEAQFWLERGRADFPNAFLDSWVDYALMTAAVARKDLPAVLRIRADVENRYPPSDPWVTLLKASAEAFEWLGGRGR